MKNNKDAEIGHYIEEYFSGKKIHRTNVQDIDLDHFQEMFSLSGSRKSYLKTDLLEGTDKDFEDLCSGKRSIHKIWDDINKSKNKTTSLDLYEVIDSPIQKIGKTSKNEDKIQGNYIITLLLKKFRDDCKNCKAEVSIYSEIFFDLLDNGGINIVNFKEFIEILDEKINSIEFSFTDDRKDFFKSFERFKLIIRYEDADKKYCLYLMSKLK